MQNDLTKNTGGTQDNRKIIVSEFHTKWEKFSEQELSALKGKDDLVSQVQAKYGLNKEQALRDIDALLKGRPF
ncbi:MAG: hypothetical protein ACLPPF_22990 [Rhodomicrobium sp.]